MRGLLWECLLHFQPESQPWSSHQHDGGRRADTLIVQELAYGSPRTRFLNYYYSFLPFSLIPLTILISSFNKKFLNARCVHGMKAFLQCELDVSLEELYVAYCAFLSGNRKGTAQRELTHSFRVASLFSSVDRGCYFWLAVFINLV